MGTLYLAAGSTSKGGGGYTTLVLLAVMIGVFYMLILRPQRNRQRQAAQTQNQIMPGQRIRTTAGIYGTVVSGDDRDVVIEIAPGVHVTMLRRAIMEVLPDDYGTAAPEEDEPAEAGSYEAAPTEDEPGHVTDSELPEDEGGKEHRTEQDKK